MISMTQKVTKDIRSLEEDQEGDTIFEALLEIDENGKYISSIPLQFNSRYSISGFSLNHKLIQN